MDRYDLYIAYFFLLLETLWMFPWFAIMIWFNLDGHAAEIFEPSHFVGVLHTLSVPLLYIIVVDYRHKEKTLKYIWVALLFVGFIDVRGVLHSFYVLPETGSNYWAAHLAVAMSALILSVLETTWFGIVVLKDLFSPITKKGYKKPIAPMSVRYIK